MLRNKMGVSAIPVLWERSWDVSCWVPRARSSWGELPAGSSRGRCPQALATIISPSPRVRGTLGISRGEGLIFCPYRADLNNARIRCAVLWVSPQLGDGFW